MIPKLQRVFVPGAIFLSMVISIAVAQIPVTLRGAIESISSQTLAVKEHDGKITNVKLADDVHVFTLKQASLANLKRGGIVGTTAIQQMRGGQQAVEIYIFPNDPNHEPNDTVHSIIDSAKLY